jgi:hypothetical protein
MKSKHHGFRDNSLHIERERERERERGREKERQREREGGRKRNFSEELARNILDFSSTI